LRLGQLRAAEDQARLPSLQIIFRLKPHARNDFLRAGLWIEKVNSGNIGDGFFNSAEFLPFK
jgi:hypothetical protein